MNFICPYKLDKAISRQDLNTPHLLQGVQELFSEKKAILK